MLFLEIKKYYKILLNYLILFLFLVKIKLFRVENFQTYKLKGIKKLKHQHKRIKLMKPKTQLKMKLNRKSTKKIRMTQPLRLKFPSWTWSKSLLRTSFSRPRRVWCTKSTARMTSPKLKKRCKTMIFWEVVFYSLVVAILVSNIL